MPTAEILSQGDEVVTGQIVDTNAAWLSDRLTTLGFTVVRHLGVGDRIDDLVDAFRRIDARADLCICTGGLGPTDDDLTSNAVATAFERPLQLDREALARLEARYGKLGREMAEVNTRQAWLPKGSVRLDNDWGTAPGFAFSGDHAWFACLPGVPREMVKMFDQRVLPLLQPQFELQPSRLVTLRCVGVGESDLQQALEGWSSPHLVLSFRTKLPENHLKLRAGPLVSNEQLLAAVEGLLERVGRWVFTVEGAPDILPGFDTGGGDHATAVARRIAARGHTLATAESCTGGRLAAACTGIPGASAWFREGVIAYANDVKVRLLGVSEETLAAHGAVSEPVAREMAIGVRTRAGTTWGIGVTGIAGPGGGSEAKPVGTVHIAVDGIEGGTTHRALRLPGDRHQIQDLCVAAGLEILRHRLHP